MYNLYFICGNVNTSYLELHRAQHVKVLLSVILFVLALVFDGNSYQS